MVTFGIVRPVPFSTGAAKTLCVSLKKTSVCSSQSYVSGPWLPIRPKVLGSSLNIGNMFSKQFCSDSFGRFTRFVYGGHRSSGCNGRRFCVAGAIGAGGPFAQAGARYKDPPRVCILGGGFGGLYTAVRLDSLMWPDGTKPQVTLIDQNDRFVFKPMLYELLNDSVQPWEVAPRFEALLEPHGSVRFVQGRVAAVEPAEAGPQGGSPAGGRVVLSDGEPVEYDWLVLALGSDATPRGVPGARELAVPFVNFDDAMKVRSHLEVIERGASPSVTVVGGGFSGVELAAVVAERLGPRGSVRLVNPGREILPQADAGQREAAQRTLSGLGVAVVAGARVVGIERGSSDQGKAPAKRVVKLLQDNSQQDTAMETDLVLWTVGSVPASTAGGEAGSFRQQPAFQMPFPTNARGATKTEPTLQVVSHSNVFALGDVSNVHVEAAIGADAHLPQTAQVAFQQADYVAWNVWASINGRPLLPFRYQHLGSMMSLGRTSGAVSLPIPVPPPVSSSLATSQLGKLLSDAGVQVSPSGLTLEGSLGGFVRRAAYWYRQPTGDHRNRVGVSWVSRLAKDAADSAGTAGVGSFLSLLQRVASSGQAPRS